MYSFIHLKMAGEIISSDQVDQFGTPLYSKRDKSWASDVITWFHSIYKAAKALKGQWCVRIKMVWAAIKNRLALRHIRSKLRRVSVNRHTKDVVLFFKSGTYAVFNQPVVAETYWGEQPFRYLMNFIKAIR